MTVQTLLLNSGTLMNEHMSYTVMRQTPHDRVRAGPYSSHMVIRESSDMSKYGVGWMFTAPVYIRLIADFYR